MTVLGLEHVNIRTSNLPATIAFFRDVLLMHVGPSPRSQSIEHGAWVFDATGAAVVHLADREIIYPSDTTFPFHPAPGSGSLHHIALKCADFASTLARVKAQGLSFYENHIDHIGLKQIFVRQPDGILFELNFPSGGATG